MKTILTFLLLGLVFNGTTSQVSIPGNGTPVDLLTSQMTMAIWFKPTSIPSTEADLISKWSGGFYYLLQFSQTTPGQISVAYGHPGIANYGCGTTISTPGVWHHAASTWDQPGGLTKIFLDGVQCAFISASAPLNPNHQSLFLGARDAGLAQPFPGVLCDMGIWNVPLQNAEILALAKGTAANRIRRTSMVAYIPGQIGGADLSGNLQNGTLTNVTVGNHCPVGPPAS